MRRRTTVYLQCKKNLHACSSLSICCWWIQAWFEYIHENVSFERQHKDFRLEYYDGRSSSPQVSPLYHWSKPSDSSAQDGLQRLRRTDYDCSMVSHTLRLHRSVLQCMGLTTWIYRHAVAVVSKGREVAHLQGRPASASPRMPHSLRIASVTL